jgi:hypothetical protein
MIRNKIHDLSKRTNIPYFLQSIITLTLYPCYNPNPLSLTPSLPPQPSPLTPSLPPKPSPLTPSLPPNPLPLPYPLTLYPLPHYRYDTEQNARLKQKNEHSVLTISGLCDYKARLSIAFILCVHYLCLIGRVYVYYVGHVNKSSLYETLFHCNILSKHHHHHLLVIYFLLLLIFLYLCLSGWSIWKHMV